MHAGSFAGSMAAKAALWAATLAFLAPMAAQATTLVRMSLEETVEAADAVVRGTVVDRTSGLHRDSAGNEWVVTFIDVAVEHTYVGEGVPATVRYMIPGGTAPNGDTVSVPSGFPNEAVGAHVLLMIEEVPIPETYAVAGAAQGRYYVTEAGDGTATVSRMPIDARLIDRASLDEVTSAGSGVLTTLGAIEERIANAARAQGKTFHKPKPATDSPAVAPEMIACPDDVEDDDAEHHDDSANAESTGEVAP